MNRTIPGRESVKEAYSGIASSPQNAPPFPVGRALAESLGYPPGLLSSLPTASVEAFCGVSNVSLFAAIPTGVTVLDLGAGAGLDTLIAARRTGESGKVFAIDFSLEMLTRARQAIAEAQVANVETYLANAEQLPIEDDSMDVALVNGIFNLNPLRDRIFAELARVLKPDGTVYAAELVLSAPLPPEETQSPEDWYR